MSDSILTYRVKEYPVGSILAELKLTKFLVLMTRQFWVSLKLADLNQSLYQMTKWEHVYMCPMIPECMVDCSCRS